MILDLTLIKNEVAKLAESTGEKYVSLKMEINKHEDLPTAVEWSCYTALSGHTRRYDTPVEAITDTLKACSDPGKLLAQAEAFEAEARALRSRVPKAIGGDL